jgi:hypothetical protein
MAESLIRKGDHYFRHGQMAAVAITDGQLTVGATIHGSSHTTDFYAEGRVDSARNTNPFRQPRWVRTRAFRVNETCPANRQVYRVTPD